MNIRVDLSNTGIPSELINEKRDDAQSYLHQLWHNVDGALSDIGWVKYPNLITDSELEIIETLAKEIRDDSDVLLVLGVGGSYMGAKAITDLLPGDGKTEVVFYGYDFSARHLRMILKQLEGKEYSICAVSKSGGTMEPMAAFSILMEHIVNKYGIEEASSRTYVVTEDKKSALHDYAEEINCHIIHMPMDIGGRYSVLTGVGLLPLAVHGINIRELIEGAKSIAYKEAFSDSGLDYAICRNIFSSVGSPLLDGTHLMLDSNKGDSDKGASDSGIPKTIEAFEVFDPYAEYFGNWLQQLFGESEGKDGKGIFPTVLMFNRDLHSMGQFLQQGAPTFFETMLFLGNQKATSAEDGRYIYETEIPETTILPELSHKKLDDISYSVEQGVLAAHIKGGIPLITISIDEVSPRSIGELMYFFMIECAVSALMLGVNPFDQPGVEAYKAEVKKLI